VLRLCGKGSDSSNGDDCESDPLCSARANFAVGQGETVGPPCDGSFSRPLLGTDWTGLDWTGLDWTGLDWTGLYWYMHVDSILGRHGPVKSFPDWILTSTPVA
jgi:hypothetical protein